MISEPILQLEQAIKVAQFLGNTQRSRRFSRASQFYWGNQYEDLYDWEDDVALEKKKPKVHIRLVKDAVDDAAAHLFGEGQKPEFSVEKLPGDIEINNGEEGEENENKKRLDEINSILSDLMKGSGLDDELLEIARLGNLHGTVAVGFHVFDDRVDVEVIKVADTKPTFGRDDRRRAVELDIGFRELLELDERWLEVQEDRDTGEEKRYHHRRIWKPNEIVEFKPIEEEGREVEDAEQLDWTVDPERTVEHELGFVPAVWIQNLPVSGDIDGQAIVEEPERKIEEEINYTLSQTGRALRYNQEPQPVFKDVRNFDYKSPVKRSADQVLSIESTKDGNAEADLLELQGAGVGQVKEYVSKLRDFFRAITRSTRQDPEKKGQAISGAALKRLLRPLLMLIGQERGQYGPKISRLLEKMLEALTGEKYTVSASWPDIVKLTPQDKLQVVQIAMSAKRSGLVTKQKAVELIAPLFGVEDVVEFMEELEEEEAFEQSGGTQGVAETVAQQAAELENL